jgi:hypothetical protein
LRNKWVNPPAKEKPTNDVSDLVDEYVLLRGERGQGKRITTKACLSFETDDILEFAEQNSAEPSLLVFDTTSRSDWSCLSAIT